jgi:hypothetical protein
MIRYLRALEYFPVAYKSSSRSFRRYQQHYMVFLVTIPIFAAPRERKILPHYYASGKVYTNRRLIPATEASARKSR